MPPRSIFIERITPATCAVYAEFLLHAAGEPAAITLCASGEALWDERVFVLLAQTAELKPMGAAVAVVIPKADARRGFVFVDELLVLPEFRRQGVARALLARVEQLAREGGWAGVRLLARPENEAARRLYAQLGYTESLSVFYELTL